MVYRTGQDSSAGARSTTAAAATPVFSPSSTRRRRAVRARKVRTMLHNSWRSWPCSSEASPPARAATPLASCCRTWPVDTSKAPVDSKTMGWNRTPCPSHRSSSLQMLGLHPGIGCGRCTTLFACLKQALPSLWRRDGDVECGRRPPKERQEDVSRPPGCKPAVFRPLRKQDFGFFPLRLQTSPVCPAQHNLPDGVVSTSPLPTGCANTSMKGVSVKNRIVPRVPSVQGSLCNPQSQAELCQENCRLHPANSMRDSCKKGARTRMLLRVQKCFIYCRSGGKLSGPCRGVHQGS